MNAMKIRISKRSVEQLEARATRYVAWDTVLPGFGVKVMPSGSKSYLLKYRAGGGRGGTVREPVIGRFPQIAPDQARSIAKQWAAEVALGNDPGGARQEVRMAPTMNDLFERYIDDHARPHKKASSLGHDRGLIKTILGPQFGKRKVADLNRSEVARWHAGMADRPYQANRALALLSKAMNLTELWGWRAENTNPCRKVRKFGEIARERFLSAEELGRLGEALSAAEAGEITTPSGLKISPFAIAAIRLLLLTGARRSEVLSLRWDWVDLQTGRANLPDSKTGKKTLHMPEAAVSILRSLPRFKDNPHVVCGGKPGAALVNIRDPWSLIRTAAGLESVRLHDLRHSFASVAAGARLSLPMIGALLGHRNTATTARYAHLADDPRRQAADQIEYTIDTALSGLRSGGDLP